MGAQSDPPLFTLNLFRYDMPLADWLPDGDLSEEEAVGIYVAFQEASSSRAKLHAKKLSRGYYGTGKGKGGGRNPSDRKTEQLKARTRCRVRNELGHWK